MAKLTWNDINVVWTPDLTGPNGPAARMRSNTEIKVACVVTPDYFGLVGTPDNPGAEGTLKGVHRLIGTSELGHVVTDLSVSARTMTRLIRTWSRSSLPDTSWVSRP